MINRILFLALLLFSLGNTIAQDSKPPKIYLDCNFCDQDYFKQNISHVEFVRDRKVADVHLLFTSQRNGSGGQSQNIQFIGLGEYDGMLDTLNYSIDVNMTNDEKRKIQVKHIQLGLVRYWLKKGMSSEIDLTLTEDEVSDSITKDPWNYWVFGINFGGWANGQETYTSINGNGTISAKRLTKKNKFSFRARYNRNYQRYNYDNEIVIGNQQSFWMNTQEIISINDHWSYGFFNNTGNSIFSNYYLYSETLGGIEYNIFPYEESSTKQIIFSYTVGGRYNDYYDTTVFNKEKEIVGLHKAQVAGSLNQQWGSLSGSVSFENYLHDFSLNSTSFWLNFNVRLFKGFSWRINGTFSILHNQINLSKGNASIEEVLLQQQQLGSGYSYWLNTGINYSFGSIYNSIVNPRFDF